MAEEPAYPTPGLYRTTIPLPGKEQAIPPGRLVYFHDRSDQGPPIVLLPKEAVDNRWRFHERGYLVEDESWPSTLVALPNQGFYRLARELQISRAGRLPADVLVQLSYTPKGQAVVFPGALLPGNRIQFPRQGLPLSDLQLDALEPLGFKLLRPQQAPQGEGDDESEKTSLH